MPVSPAGPSLGSDHSGEDMSPRGVWGEDVGWRGLVGVGLACARLERSGGDHCFRRYSKVMRLLFPASCGEWLLNGAYARCERGFGSLFFSSPWYNEERLYWPLACAGDVVSLATGFSLRMMEMEREREFYMMRYFHRVKHIIPPVCLVGILK